MHQKIKCIFVVGPTATGKSDIAIQLAHTLGNAVIIGCDSRQIFHELHLASGSVDGNWSITQYGRAWVSYTIPHFLIKHRSIYNQYSVSDYTNDFNELVDYWYRSSYIPEYCILCGGTMYYAQAILEGWEFFPDTTPRSQWLTYSLEELQSNLQKRNIILNESDCKNKKRIQSALSRSEVKKNGLDPRLSMIGVFGVDKDDAQLKERIALRLHERICKGMIEEVEKLSLTDEQFTTLGLEVRACYAYLRGWIAETSLETFLQKKIWKYVKRQRTYLKKISHIRVDVCEDILALL